MAAAAPIRARRRCSSIPRKARSTDPVLEGLDDQQLARLAVACAGGQALEVETLTGPSITVPVPAPGERIDAIAQPGQQINLQGGEFVMPPI